MLWVTRGKDRVVSVGAGEGGFLTSTFSVLKNRSFRRVAGLFLAAWSIIAAVSAMVPFYVEHHMHHKGLLDAVFAAIQFAALAGVGVAAAHVLPWSMLPDVIEADKVETGHDRAGAFYGVMTFLEKSATAVALFLLGQVLGLAGYVEGAAAQPESARLAILGLVALAAWKLPPLTRGQHRELLRRLTAEAPKRG